MYRYPSGDYNKEQLYKALKDLREEILEKIKEAYNWSIDPKKGHGGEKFQQGRWEALMWARQAVQDAYMTAKVQPAPPEAIIDTIVYDTTYHASTTHDEPVVANVTDHVAISCTPRQPGKPDCTTCRGDGEALYMYPRGPTDPPGNCMITCPECFPKEE